MSHLRMIACFLIVGSAPASSKHFTAAAHRVRTARWRGVMLRYELYPNLMRQLFVHRHSINNLKFRRIQPPSLRGRPD